MNDHEKYKLTLFTLVALIVLFAGLMEMGDYVFKDDGQIFQVNSNVLSGLVGALLTFLQLKGQDKPQDISVRSSGNPPTVTTTIQTPPTQEGH